MFQEEMEMKLFYLAATGDLEGTKRMIESGASVNALDYNSRSPLHLAAENGHVEVVEYLTAKGASTDCQDDAGETPLSLAMSRGHRRVQLALAKGRAELGREQGAQRFKGANARSFIMEAFPRRIAQAMLEGRRIEPVSKERVSLFFSDIVGFTEISSTMQACKVADMLTRLFKRFDQLAVLHGVEKIDTVGDSYIAATNFAHERSSDHAARLANFAIDAMQAAQETLVDEDDPHTHGHVQLRIGMHCGPVTGSVIGLQSLKYTLLGDAVNTASRMESTSEPGRIQCSEATATLLMEQAGDGLALNTREGGIFVKGKGHMQTFWLMTSRKCSALLKPAIHESLPRSKRAGLHSSRESGSSGGRESAWCSQPRLSRPTNAGASAVGVCSTRWLRLVARAERPMFCARVGLILIMF